MRTWRSAPAVRPRPPASARARRSSPARRSATAGTGLHLAFGIVSALYQRTRTGRGQKVLCAMQDGVLNLARVKLRDQQRLAHGPLTEYSQYGEGVAVRKAVPRAGNDSGGGQPGWILKCKGWETDPDAYIYFITQAPVWGAICDLIGKPEWKTDPDYATPPARLPRLKHIFAPSSSGP
jgi:formyl-CoA transferase